MTQEFVVVWRSKEGAAVQTYAHPDKSPRVFTDDDAAPEAEGAQWVDQDTLGVLLANHEAFHPKRVDRATASTLLGWSV